MEDSAIVDLYWQRSDRAIAETEQIEARGTLNSYAFHTNPCVGPEVELRACGISTGNYCYSVDFTACIIPGSF